MGNSSSSETLTPQQRRNTTMKASDLRKLHKQIAFEYPALGSVQESMLVTDNRLPDCPIVYANDQFEQMSLYPKEAILGVNCRFLQGPLTDRKVVTEIRKAVDNSQALEVEILNYRRDGVPFWNLFLMLPIHDWGKRTGKANFFIAIQKDVSLIKGLRKDVSTWSAPEVAMWLEKCGLSEAALIFNENRIEGHQLVELNDNDLRGLGIKISHDREAVLEAIAREFVDGHYITPDTTTLEPSADLHITVDLQEARNTIEVSKPLEVWGKQTGVGSQRMAHKCYIKDEEPVVFLLPQQTSLKKLRIKLARRLGQHYRIEIEDFEGERHVLNSDEDLEAGYLLSEEETNLRLYLSKPRPFIRGGKLDILSTITNPLIVVDYFGTITFANEEATNFCGATDQKDLIGRKLKTLANELDANRIRSAANQNGKKSQQRFAVELGTIDNPAKTRQIFVNVRNFTQGVFVVNLLRDAQIFEFHKDA